MSRTGLRHRRRKTASVMLAKSIELASFVQCDSGRQSEVQNGRRGIGWTDPARRGRERYLSASGAK
ncbi:MAG: hypothetical protein CMJ64_14010 [Planctomycetaceae bacterium]|nr:hypothetical protein [Planctomycetaceae bacterium]